MKTSGVLRTLFWKRLVSYIHIQPTVIPLDEALTMRSIADADVIDMDGIFPDKTQSVLPGGQVDLSVMRDADIPFDTSNAFVQFRIHSNGGWLNHNGWTGVHIVPLDPIEFSLMFPGPSSADYLSNYPRVWGLFSYHEFPYEISLGAIGALIGLHPDGGVSAPWFFPVHPVQGMPAEDDDDWRLATQTMAWMIRSIFSAFAAVNQGQAILHSIEPRCWEILPLDE